MRAQYLLLAPFALAFEFLDQPDCAVPCLEEAINKVNCTLDLQCVCPESTQESIRKEATGCVLKNCRASDALKAQKAAVEACATFTPDSIAVKTHSVPTFGAAPSTSTSAAAAGGPSVAIAAALLAVFAL